jgi:hypothetical protein
LFGEACSLPINFCICFGSCDSFFGDEFGGTTFFFADAFLVLESVLLVDILLISSFFAGVAF